ncbi:hypothetical protein C0Q70_09720 [Pomacea canaliculata]|uniref:Uncharacterized protein n=1 Tax=Pomacea canaliculata TaxID=400727 RepID=A0A2T7PAK4_POMCA|nr:hypothetical protein C0Q70_09720 [Pomacea canaliculata]
MECYFLPSRLDFTAQDLPQLISCPFSANIVSLQDAVFLEEVVGGDGDGGGVLMNFSDVSVAALTTRPESKHPQQQQQRMTKATSDDPGD